MKKNLLFLLSLFILSSCGVHEDVFLYDESDPEYQYVLAEAEKQCRESAIFKEINNSLKFKTYGYNIGKIFKIEHKLDDSVEDLTYIKIIGVDDTALTYLHTFGSGSSSNSKIVFTPKNGVDMIEAISSGVCTMDKKQRYGSAGLSSTKSMSFDDNRAFETKDSDEDVNTYIRVYEVNRINLTYPIPFALYNFDRTIRKVSTPGGKEKTYKHKYSISVISQSDCNDRDKNPNCDFRDENFPAATIEVNRAAYKSDKLESVPFEINYFYTPLSE